MIKLLLPKDGFLNKGNIKATRVRGVEVTSLAGVLVIQRVAGIKNQSAGMKLLIDEFLSCKNL